MTRNARTTQIELDRLEICDLMLACTRFKSAAKAKGNTAKRWEKLHDKLKAQLVELDAKIDADGLTMRKHTDLSTKFLMEIIENGTYDTPVMRYVYDKSEGTIRCAGLGRLDDPDAWQLVASDIKEN